MKSPDIEFERKDSDRLTITSRTRNRVSRGLESIKHEKIPYQIDRMLSHRINPCDTLVVSGFWRSGTTWLQQSLAEILKAKTVFEPFHFMVPAVKEIYAYNQLSTKDVLFLELYMPYYGDSILNGHPLHGFFDKALRADISGRVVRLLRNSVIESFRPRIVLKLVRGQLCLRAIQNTFSAPVIHIYRDPRAIVASIKGLWWDSMYEHLYLREQLIEPRDGRAEFFSNWYDDILEYDKRDTVTRIVAYWALTEKFVQHCYADQQAHISFVSYEELCRERNKSLLGVLKKLSVSHVPSGNFRALDADSWSTMAQRRGVSNDERITGWMKILSSSEIATVESIVQRFGFDDRLVNDR